MAIDDLILKAKALYPNFAVDDHNKYDYVVFLMPQLKGKELTESDKAYYADKLIMYSLMTKQTPITTRKGHKVLRQLQMLKELRVRGYSANFWPDDKLYELFQRRQQDKARFYPTYKELIDEVGKNSHVATIWKQVITYSTHIAKTRTKGVLPILGNPFEHKKLIPEDINLADDEYSP